MKKPIVRSTSIELNEKMMKLASTTKSTALVKRRIEHYIELLSLNEITSDICLLHNIYTDFGLVSPRLYLKTDLQRVQKVFKQIVHGDMKTTFKKV